MGYSFLSTPEPLNDFDPALRDRIIIVYEEYARVWGFGVEAVGENDVGDFVDLRVVFIAARRIGFAFGMGVIVDHLAAVFFDVVEDVEQVVGGDDGEIVGLLGGVGGRVVLDYQVIFAAQRAAGFVGIAIYDMLRHLVI